MAEIKIVMTDMDGTYMEKFFPGQPTKLRGNQKAGRARYSRMRCDGSQPGAGAAHAAFRRN